jgi:hypothetical protein
MLSFMNLENSYWCHRFLNIMQNYETVLEHVENTALKRTVFCDVTRCSPREIH